VTRAFPKRKMPRWRHRRRATRHLVSWWQSRFESAFSRWLRRIALWGDDLQTREVRAVARGIACQQGHTGDRRMRTDVEVRQRGSPPAAPPPVPKPRSNALISPNRNRLTRPGRRRAPFRRNELRIIAVSGSALQGLSPQTRGTCDSRRSLPRVLRRDGWNRGLPGGGRRLERAGLGWDRQLQRLVRSPNR
jgi:hypothetical protein